MSIFIYVRTWLAMCNKINKDCIAIFFYIFSSSGSRFMCNSFSLCSKSSADLLFGQCHKPNYLKKWINNSFLLLLKCPYLRGKKPLLWQKGFIFHSNFLLEKSFSNCPVLGSVPAHVMQRLVWSILLKWSRSASTSPTPLGVPTPQSRGFPVNKKQMLERIQNILCIRWICGFIHDF